MKTRMEMMVGLECDRGAMASVESIVMAIGMTTSILSPVDRKDLLHGFGTNKVSKGGS